MRHPGQGSPLYQMSGGQREKDFYFRRNQSGWYRGRPSPLAGEGLFASLAMLVVPMDALSHRPKEGVGHA
jgi:hypothetical protein